MNNLDLFDDFYKTFIDESSVLHGALMQKAQHSEHVAPYAYDLMETSGFQGLKSVIEQSAQLTVMPAVIIDRNARALDSAYCVSVQVSTRDESPLRPHLASLTPLAA